MKRRAPSSRLAIVTGRVSGISEKLIGQDADVVIAGIEAVPLAAAAGELDFTNSRTDVADLAAVEALARSSIDRIGRVKIVCNNARLGSMGAVRSMSMADWQCCVDTSLRGVLASSPFSRG